jgi:metallo-beta-lactamase superfamily protein
MAKRPTAIEVRSYQVGFGDCFLLSFIYSEADKRHVLIDFGTTGLPGKRKPSEHMPKIARAIAEVVGENRRLTAVVATHRHEDHISGFATNGKNGGSGKLIKALRPHIVLQPWTEDPRARPDARSATTISGDKKGFVARLMNMNALADRVRKLAASNPPWMSAVVRRELQFLGEDNLKNKSAVDNLIAMGKAGDEKPRFLRYGDKTGLEALLPGVKVRVLGPPDLTQTNAIRRQRSKDNDQFWHFVRGVVPQATAVQAASNGKRRSKAVPKEARWFRDRLQSVTGQGLLEIVRQLDDQMNNTSLILLFEVFGRKLLFPGDAQFENWSYAMTEAPDKDRVAELVAEVDFYKVGHHGSLNATPRQWLWQSFRKRKGRQLQTMMSTMSNKHGKKSSNTEVPRRTLVTALRSGTQLKNTQNLKGRDIVNITTIKPKGA